MVTLPSAPIHIFANFPYQLMLQKLTFILKNLLIFKFFPIIMLNIVTHTVSENPPILTYHSFHYRLPLASVMKAVQTLLDQRLLK